MQPYDIVYCSGSFYNFRNVYMNDAPVGSLSIFKISTGESIHILNIEFRRSAS